jgi:hypothetical protein
VYEQCSFKSGKGFEFLLRKMSILASNRGFVSFIIEMFPDTVNQLLAVGGNLEMIWAIGFVFVLVAPLA